MYNLVLCYNNIVLAKLKKHCDFTKDCVIYPEDCEYRRKGMLCETTVCEKCPNFIEKLSGKTVLASGLSVCDAAKAMNYTNYSIDETGYDVEVAEIREYHIMPSLVVFSTKPVPKRSCIQCEHIKYASYRSNIDTAYCSKLDKEVPIAEILSKVMDGCPEPNIKKQEK